MRPYEEPTAATVDAHDPYRATSYALPKTFTPRERQVLASTARWMRIAGGLNVLIGALLVGRLMSIPLVGVGVGDLLGLVGVSMLAALTWSAGRALRRVESSARPYVALEACLAQVRTVFRVKGYFVICVMVLWAMTFVASFVAALLD